MSNDNELKDEFVLTLEDARMLMDYINGNEHMINQDELNSLLQDMDDFVEGIDLNETGS